MRKIIFCIHSEPDRTVLKTNDGTKFVNSTLTACFSELGVIHITTASLCPETNGKAERNVKRCTLRTLKDTDWAMLCQAELPEFLLAETMACTVYIQNSHPK
jgi:transposase InsO family protein